MRINSIRLQWFRGASETVNLDLNGDSAVIFGANGAGKSSFVDGIEALLSAGKVSHLGHEYSGRNQEKGLVNTSRPVGQTSLVEVELADGSTEALNWQAGSPSRTKQGITSVEGWDYRRTALRQEELSAFIRATKGDKYGAIVPLLGLAHLEVAADNLHKLVKAIERKGDLPTLRSKLTLATERRREVFGDQTNEQLISRLEEHRQIYAPDIPVESRLKTAADVLAAIDAQIATLTEAQRRAAAVGEIAASDLSVRLKRVTGAAARIAEVAEPLIKERLEVLAAAEEFASKRGDDASDFPCPACGREIEAQIFGDHLTSERDRLAATQVLYDEHRSAVGEVCDEVARLAIVAGKQELERWHNDLPEPLRIAAAYLRDLSVPRLRSNCGVDEIAQLESNVLPIVLRAAEDAKMLPPEVQTLVTHQNEGRALFASLKAGSQRASLNRADALIKLTKELESGVREEIAERARLTFESISTDVQGYWKILQPQDAITDIRLVVPDDNDKAVEVALRFHGKQQDSPRLTLSEGQRNALGLCIFLAMANKAGDEDRPIFLDDVVISFDREHRSRVAVLLREHFGNRQLAVLTHDREWFFELQRMLPRKAWEFRRLVPYDKPEVGIRFFDNGTDFAEVRARATAAPEEALGNARRLMDVALSEIAERVGLKLPYLRGDDNDHRTAGQFLVALEKAVPKAFRVKEHGVFVANQRAEAALKKVKPELAIWGNRGAHTFSGSQTEALDLIDGCEEVLNAFFCIDCDTPLGAYDGAQGRGECRCGNLQWRPTSSA